MRPADPTDVPAFGRRGHSGARGQALPAPERVRPGLVRTRVGSGDQEDGRRACGQLLGAAPAAVGERAPLLTCRKEQTRAPWPRSRTRCRARQGRARRLCRDWLFPSLKRGQHCYAPGRPAGSGEAPGPKQQFREPEVPGPGGSPGPQVCVTPAQQHDRERGSGLPSRTSGTVVRIPWSSDRRPISSPDTGGPGPLTCVHAGEHQAQGGHGPMRAVHVHPVHAELDQGLGIQPGQLLGQQEALQAPQDAVVDGGRRGLLASRQHHPTHLSERRRPGQGPASGSCRSQQCHPTGRCQAVT